MRAVNRWRKKTKQRIIEAMGGKCYVCGYNKCDEVLSLHHLNPSQKTLSLSAIRANPRSWERIVNELKKCIMVCMNCHAEIHYGIITLSENIGSTFNETYNTYPKYERVDWSKFDIVDMYKKLGINQTAQAIGCTYTSVKKKLIRMGLIVKKQ